MRFVVGFAYDKIKMRDNARVLLIRKARPDWQKGKINGIGGKLGEYEAGTTGMEREWKEEVKNAPDVKWDLFCSLIDKGNHIYFYRAILERETMESLEGAEDEKLEVWKIGDIKKTSHVWNLPWLLRMGLDSRIEDAIVDLKDTK